MALSVRLATEDDAEAIRSIYNVEVLESTATFDLVPRTLDDQLAWQRARSGAYAAIVAVDDEAGGAVVGFGSLSPYKDRPAYSTTVEDSVYVARASQGRGVGRLVLGELLAVAADHGFHAVMARISGEGGASIGLHAALGFEQIGREREVGRKFGKWLDVVVMQRLL
jgi:phosphinothricin acetyltransferase